VAKQLNEDGIDAELIAVLEEDADASLETKDADIETGPEAVPLAAVEEIPEPEMVEVTSQDGVPEPELVTPEKIEQPPADLDKPEESPDDIGVRQLLAKFGSSVDEIISNQKADRSQIDDAILYLDGVIKKAIANDEKLSPMYVDAWARLHQAKADVNANASKVLDSVAKLLSAGKGNELVLNLGLSASGDIDLEELLKQDKYEDEKIDRNDGVL
jgi:hypothetical protein